jgi:hypothetical protein
MRDRRPKLHIPRANEHQLTLIGMVARGRTKRRDEDKPHLASVLRIGAALQHASIHHDHLANVRARSSTCLMPILQREIGPTGQACGPPTLSARYIGPPTRSDDAKGERSSGQWL